MRAFPRALLVLCATCSAAAAADVYLFDAIRSPAYARALATLLRSAGGLPDWTRELVKPRGDYVAAPAEYQTIAGTRYELFNGCKAHDCADNRIEVMFAPNGTQAWGAILIDGKTITYLGGPSPAQQSALKAAVQP